MIILDRAEGIKSTVENDSGTHLEEDSGQATRPIHNLINTCKTMRIKQ
jgi:hypothetical protein